MPSRIRLIASAGAVVSMLFVAGALPAHAYLDPGTGSMLLQLLLGGVAGALVVVRLYWSNVKTRFARLTKKRGTGEAQDTQ